MQQTKVVSTDKGDIIVKELSVDDVYDLAGRVSQNDGIQDFMDEFKSLIEMSTNLKFEDFRKFYPSEIVEVYEAFKEVNQAFFVLAEALGLGELMRNLRDSIAIDLKSVFATLFQAAIDPTISDVTGGDSSSEPSTTPVTEE